MHIDYKLNICFLLCMKCNTKYGSFQCYFIILYRLIQVYGQERDYFVVKNSDASF